MSDILDSFKEYAIYVTKSNDWDNAYQYLNRVSTYKNGWRLCAVCIRRLMQKVKTPRQAAIVSRLIVECMPMETPTAITVYLHQAERRCYERLGSPWGIEKSIVREIAATPQGRAYLASLRSPRKETK